LFPALRAILARDITCMTPQRAALHVISGSRITNHLLTGPISMAHYTQTMSMSLVIRSARAVCPDF